MEKTGPTVCQLSDFRTKLCWIDLLLLYLRFIIFSFFFIATGVFQEEVVHTVLNKQKAPIF